MMANEILGGGKKRGHRKSNPKKGGFGLTGAISTGLLLAAEELYRESLKKHSKKKHGGSDVLSAELNDAAAVSVEQLLNGGKHCRHRNKGGAGIANEASALNGEPLEHRDGSLLSEAFNAPIKGGRKGRGRARRHSRSRSHSRHHYGGMGVASFASPLNGDNSEHHNGALISEAFNTHTHTTGGRRGRSARRGGAYADFVSAMNNSMPYGENTSHDVSLSAPPMDPQAGGRRRHHSPKSKSKPKSKSTGMHTMMPMPMSMSWGGNENDQDGGRKKRRGRPVKHRGGNGDAAPPPAPPAPATGGIGGMLNNLVGHLF